VKSEFNYRHIDYLIKNCPDKFFKWWDPYKIKMDSGTVSLLAEHCGQFCEVWWTNSISSDALRDSWQGNRIWMHLIKNCGRAAYKWWNSDIFPWYNDTLVNLLSEDGEKFKSVWGADYIMHKLHSEVLEVTF